MTPTAEPQNPYTLPVTVLGALAVVALGWSVYAGMPLWTQGKFLKIPLAPHGVVSLALAPTQADAQAILAEWDCGTRSAPTPDQGRCAAAREAVRLDHRFVWAYLAAWLLVPLWAAIAGKTSRKVMALVMAGVAIGAVLDMAENALLERALTHTFNLEPARSFRLLRLAAMNKFVFLLLGIAGGVVLGFGALRKVLIERYLWREHTKQLRGGAAATRAAEDALAPLPTFSIESLIARETDGLFAMYGQSGLRSGDNPQCEINAAADEQYVSFREADLIGLALSGGGIRSATFNLGLLQELHCLKMLPLVDYLSTVSGGGYVGSFWSAWLMRLPSLVRKQLDETGKADVAEHSREWNERRDEQLFPTAGELGPGQAQRVESREERHLREFSGFLAPRWGFFEADTWTAIVALVGGLVPALVIGWSVIGLTLIAWLALTFPLASSQADGAPALTIALVTAIVLLLFERMWQIFKRETAGQYATASPEDQPAADAVPWYGGRRYLIFGALAVLLVAALQFGLRTAYTAHPQGPWPILSPDAGTSWRPAADASGIARWWAITGIDNPERRWTFSPRLFDYGVAWIAAGLLLIAWRTTSAIMPRPWTRESLAAFDRVLSRTLALGTAWIGLAILWHVSINLPGLATVGVSAVLSGAAFAALRNWIGLALRRPAQAGVLDRLKPVLPALLAYLTLILTAITVGGVLVVTGGTDWFTWWRISAAMTALLVVGLFISPDQFGMHAFYRDRIARAYTGATNLADEQGAANNRGTEPREGDDPKFTDLASRPLHLVCCAANDLSGDQVETLGRGARSAVLSKYGFSFGRYAHEWPELVPINRLASGITASAAAFNSNMGHISVRVGPAVSFLMTMLNLRLGLWVRHPLAVQAGPRRWPGLLYYREMLGLTSSSGRMSAEELPKSLMRDIHLSDGGHFENLALYELVRRHCRYIIVSDCGADPEVAFDDLGNALRRIREDFGVDVDLDVAPLRPDPVTGLSQQHVAAGRIKYSDTDTGILLYIKPSITGDEPPDVQQYRKRNVAFPHEATTDQFYDEAQWESYRRLGRHAAEHIFAFIRRDGAQSLTADWVFGEAAREWGPTPPGLADRVLEMTRRFAAVDAELQQRQQQAMLRDVFPEMTDVGGIRAILDPAGSAERSRPSDRIGDVDQPSAAARSAHDADAAVAAELSILLKVMQVMEDVWMACELDRWWGHPLNLGWINLFARWATSPPFQFWWPLMAPMFSPGFRQFIDQRFPMRTEHPGTRALPQRGTVTEVDGDPRGSGLAAIWWAERSAQPARWNSTVIPPYRRIYYQNQLELKRGTQAGRIQVGLAAVTFHNRIAGWTSDDFFVPPSLWGAGIGGRFLRGLIEAVGRHAARVVVVVKAPPPDHSHQVARDDRQAFVEHYKKVGFREKRTMDTEVERGLCEELGYDPARDTLFTLDVPQWQARTQRKA